MTVSKEAGPSGSPLEVLRVFLGLGLTSFGGPVAHLGYFRAAFVERRRWLSERAYADLVALCQFLPGPASSQVGIAIGLSRAGIGGAVAAWLAFALPSAVMLTLFALGVATWGEELGKGWLSGIKLAAVAVVAQAVLGMARTLCPDRPRQSLAVAATVLLLLWPTLWGQLTSIAVGALIGLALLRRPTPSVTAETAGSVGRTAAIACLIVFALLLALLPLLADIVASPELALFDSFYRSGSLVFGGGHVVLPLLEAEVVAPGRVSESDFLAGYGAAQAVPGPLFTFSAYLGAVSAFGPGGWSGALLCLVAIFLPSFLLVIGVMPFWDRLRARPAAQAALSGVNAAVVGLLAAAFWDPVFTGAVERTADVAFALILFLFLAIWRLPPWLVVVLAAAGGAALEGLAL